MTPQLIMLLCIGLALVLIGRKTRRVSRAGVLKTVVLGLLVFNGAAVLSAGAFLFMDPPVFAQEEQAPQEEEGQPPSASGSGWTSMAAAIAVGLGSISAGIAVSITGSAAIGGMTQNPEIFGRSLVFVGLAEGIAIYGLIIAFMLVMGVGG